MLGIYEGNSLSIALTLGFIEELLKLYNAPTIVKIKDKIAFTGGIDEAGNIEEVTKEIIENKTYNIFFSPVETFVIHRNDEPFALTRLAELKKEFPERKLEIVGVTTLDDLLNRRNLVDIRKQNPVVKVGKIAKKNALSFTFATLLIAVFIFSGLWDFDDNPAMLFNERNVLYVKNQNGKVLWTKEMVFDIKTETGNKIPFSQKIVDIDNDGINEILISMNCLIMKL